jgi:hypothetical protein
MRESRHVSTHAEFELRHEAVAEVKRLAAHPLREVERLAQAARGGETAASLAIVLVAVFLGVWTIATVVYGVVLLVARLVTG